MQRSDYLRAAGRCDRTPAVFESSRSFSPFLLLLSRFDSRYNDQVPLRSKSFDTFLDVLSPPNTMHIFPFDATPSSPRRAAKRSRLTQAPGDLLIEIASAMESRADVLNLCLTSSYIYSHVAPMLYESVVLNNLEQCTRTLGMLQRRPDVARHVRELCVRPQSNSESRHGVAVSLIASAAVRELAAAQRLDALAKFVWDGDEKPYHEDMWFALRMGCPRLRYIGTSVGRYLPSHNSHLFDFVDLIGFSLTLKPGFYDAHMDTFLDEDNASSRQLWDMLIHRCPDLEELTIEGVSSLPTDVHTIVEGRWPKLRKLSLGDVSIDWVPGVVNQTEKRPFISFLEAHPTLESLSLSRYTIQPAHLATLDPGSLQLSSFSGTLPQLQALPYLQPYLKSVTFRDPMQTREISAQAVASILQGLPRLTRLNISFNLHSMYDSGNLLRSLITSCPHLRHLELTCGNKPSFQLDAFSKSVRGFPKLRTLHLTLVKYPGDETLSAGAARIARANPRLTRFSLTFIPPAYPLPLPFSLPYLPFPFPARATGTFELTTDHHGLPLMLVGFEHFRRIWPWGLGVSSSSRRYVRDLRPLSAPGRRKTGWRALVGLVFERSAAGEEMRMMVFCGMLVGLAVWGFLSSRGGPRPRDVVRVAGKVHRPVVQGVLRFSSGTLSTTGRAVATATA
ncbi:hypothetical protein LshimejAT787_1901690 [Lyophyllum shimeji]|uniref:F-box domain-containing protein n=1 Tax=Lyophyllum shimeji TaxID=47721 RepID=A0A9P3Q1R8_LYOSH|nr:hypothetical protein LshimejAT787_1901690 [Lyophyllum shimeji]